MGTSKFHDHVNISFRSCSNLCLVRLRFTEKNQNILQNFLPPSQSLEQGAGGMKTDP